MLRGTSPDPSHHVGARQIVEHALDLKPGQQLLILLDETTVEPATAIAEAAESLGISSTAILVPIAIQRRVPRETDLSFPAQRAAREARAILTCVNARPDCLGFRQRLLETQWTAHTKIGHMPGATLDALALADVDMAQLVADCGFVEVVLARGTTVELTSYAAGGTPHLLTADLGGWERLPVASDGLIADGVWGNVPSGETYIAPIEGTAEGSFVVNGSLPGYVMAPGEEIILHFKWGRLAHIEPEKSPAAAWLRDTQISPAQAAGDLNWSNLAEIGAGLNPAAQQLTGNMLVDEKAAGTAHVALGSNTFMGGAVSATIHCDLVTRAPTIRVDGKIVVDRGRLVQNEAVWLEHFGQVSLESSPMRTASRIARSGVQAHHTPDRRLQRVLRSEPGRVSACSVGNAATAGLADRLYRHLPDSGDAVPLPDLARQAGIDASVARQVLHIMWEYDLVKSLP
ncbi:MAG: hypothetical protein JXA93_06110 [Anaerolineae bacterium]|nr:hypothetical protein [Anaerolineae bacterium]